MIFKMVICGAVIFVFVFTAYCVGFWPTAGVTKIKFNRFVNFYNIAPSTWELHDDYVVKKKPRSFCGESFGFSFTDTIRYARWKRQEEKREKQREEVEKIEWLIKMVQSDIDKYKRTAEEEVFIAAERIQEMNAKNRKAFMEMEIVNWKQK